MKTISSTTLVQQFINSAERAAVTVESCLSNAESLNETLLKNFDEGELVLFAQPFDISNDLFSKFILNKNVITDPAKEQLKNTKVGVTDAFAAIASTGSVCVSVRNNLASPASMLTRNHIVVVHSKTIVPLPRHIFSNDYLEGSGLKQSFTIITGPSATADMGPLVRGVHGPGKLHIIIIE